MKYMGFQIVFNISKVKKNPANSLAKYIFAYNLRKRFGNFFWQNHKSNYGVSLNTQKGKH